MMAMVVYEEMAGGIFEPISELNKNIKSFKYWINPGNWFVEANKGLFILVNHENTATFLVAGTIIGIWLIMMDVKWVKKWLVWSWIVYWALRGFIYPNYPNGVIG